MLKENVISKEIVKSVYAIHRELGSGLLESVYQEVVYKDLTSRGLRVAQQVKYNIYFRGEKIDKTYRVDLLVEDLVIIELKSVEFLMPVHFKQLQTYLRLSGKRLGMLINFNVADPKEGINRVVNNLR